MVKNYLSQNFSYKKTNRFLLVLLIIDLLFIIGHMIIGVRAYTDSDFDWYSFKPLMVDTERGIPEFFQYLKFILIIIFLGYLMVKYKMRGYLFWISLYLLMFLDDAFQIHEKMGIYLSENYSLGVFFGLRDKDIGELIYVAAMGIVVLIIMIVSFVKSSKSFKKRSVDLALLLFLFLFFGVGLDVAHQLFRTNQMAEFIIGMLEDSGEMIVLSIISWYFLYLIFFTETRNKYLYYIINKKYADNSVK